ncbi:MAG TPA: cell division protein FtsA [Candidatus Desulfofervidus auxilii]|uniref:Cell division protein FtsA n=1 Tax=Desulfofervidus auxilii TaxID=1621989 RepID=A0A7V1I4M2_DESA2|nr:cell division protein FtsA [Candidatus Desulfofervidus auxilii]
MTRRAGLIVGLDIGTTKVCAVVAEPSEEGKLEIIGVGCYPSHGLRKGMVVNVEETINSIKRAIEEAEMMAGCEIRSVYTGIAGNHIQSLNSQGVIALKHREVTRKDMERVIETARMVSLPPERQIIHVIPQEFIVDDQTGIHDPQGMAGVRLEVQVHIITASVAAVQTLIRCIQRAGLDVVEIVLQPLAASRAVLTEEEKTLGVALVDLGGGTTDITVFGNNSIKHSAILAVGGTNITNDIAFGLRTPLSEAEKIKLKYGIANTSFLEKDEEIEIPALGDKKSRSVSRGVLAQIIEPRVEEILCLIEQELIRTELKDTLASGMVITGGSSLLPGLIELAEQIFDLPTRVGYPRGVGGLSDVIRNPIYATAVGLAMYGFKNQKGNGHSIFRKQSILGRFINGIKNWFKEAF